MIKTELQLQRAKTFLTELEAQIDEYNVGISPDLYELIVSPLKMQKEKVEKEISEYESLMDKHDEQEGD